MAFRTFADIERFESVPLETRNLPASTYEVFRAGAARYGSRTALSFFVDAADHRRLARWSYRDLFRDITRTANALHRLGLRDGRVVAYILPNLPETHLTIWGGEAAGIAFAVNPQLGAGQMRELLQAAGAEIVVTLAPTPGVDLWQRVRAAIDGLASVRHVVWASVAPYLGAAKRLALGGMAWRERLALRRAPYRISDFRRRIAREPGDHLRSGRAIAATDIASYFCTGGTTGLPKIAMRSHRCEVFDSWAVGVCIYEQDEPPAVVLCGLPLFHVNAQLVTGLQVWLNGGSVLLATPEGYRGRQVVARLWEIVARHRVASFSGVPTLYAALLQTDPGGHDISSLRFVACGAAPMPPELLSRFEAKVGVPVIEGYGLTEAGCVSAINLPDGPRKAGTIGFRLPYQAMRIAPLDAAGRFLRWADPDEPGSVVVRGPNLFEGYLGLGAEGGWVEIEGERWLNTGDLGCQDAAGTFRLVGRAKDLIIRGGHNIDPQSIENVIGQHPEVAFVAAVGRPDRHAGEVPVAYVELSAGAVVTADALEQFARDRIGERAAIPKSVTILPSLPKTAIGKIHKPSLVKLEIEKLVAAVLAENGLAVRSIVVEQERAAGFVARIALLDPADAGAIDACLGDYAFRHAFEPA